MGSVVREAKPRKTDPRKPFTPQLFCLEKLLQFLAAAVNYFLSIACNYQRRPWVAVGFNPLKYFMTANFHAKIDLIYKFYNKSSVICATVMKSH